MAGARGFATGEQWAISIGKGSRLSFAMNIRRGLLDKEHKGSENILALLHAL
jgi:hypothetical protein